MTMLKDLLSQHSEISLAIGGLVIGAVFGAITLRTNFCTMGALSDIHNFGDWRRFRAWMLAIAVAMLVTQALAAAGAVDLARSMYLAPRLGWAGNIIGGLLMGFGMVFAGGCPSRNLVRAGSGDLRSLIVLAVIGIFAFVALGGLLGPLRSALDQATAIDLGAIGDPTRAIATQGMDALLSAASGTPALGRPLLIASIASAGLAIYCFANAAFRRSPVHILSGIGVGLCVAAGWALTGLAFDEMATRPQAPISLTFVRPAGDTLDWLQRYTALGLPGFGVASLVGAIGGAFLTALARGKLGLQTFADKGDTLRCLSGAALMGIGGVLAMGCTIGQGITGISTLAAGALLAIVGMIAGGFWGLRTLERIL